ncbi:MAG: hypothetical protein ACFNM4_07175, partial [Prevotella nigrescens]
SSTTICPAFFTVLSRWATMTTVFRLMLHGTMALLHEEPISLEGDNLELIFRRVALNSDNFEVLMSEMNQAYEDLV